jgi:hypothetical protein
MSRHGRASRTSGMSRQGRTQWGKVGTGQGRPGQGRRVMTCTRVWTCVHICGRMSDLWRICVHMCGDGDECGEMGQYTSTCPPPHTRVSCTARTRAHTFHHPRDVRCSDEQAGTRMSRGRGTEPDIPGRTGRHTGHTGQHPLCSSVCTSDDHALRHAPWGA